MNSDQEQLFQEFLAARPDMEQHITVDPELGPVIDNEAITQFALWAIENGYAPPDAFGKAIELQSKIRKWGDQQREEANVLSELPPSERR